MNANCGLFTTAGAPHILIPFFPARFNNSTPSAYEFAIGFSLHTCLPPFNATLFRRPCSCISVRFTIRSNAGPVIIWSICGYQLGTLYFLAASCAREGTLSHTLTNSTKGDLDKCGKYFCETLPQPITATFVFLFNAFNGATE